MSSFRTHNSFPGRFSWPPDREDGGTILIISLIVLSSVIISSVGLGGLIINSLQQTKILDRAAIAFYAAESGVEQGLWEVRKSSDKLDNPLPTSVPDSGGGSSLDQVMLPNGAVWTRNARKDEDEIRVAIPAGGFFELQLFDPDEDVGDLNAWVTETGINIDHISVDWEPKTCEEECPVLFAEWIRWSVQDFNVDPFIPTLPGLMSFTKRYLPGSPARIPPVVQGFPNSLTLPDYAYRIRLRAEYSTMRNVIIRAHNASGDQVRLPGRAEIEAWGQFGDTHQRILVKVPRKAPLSSLFDFAIFSECSLVKGYPISCP